MIGPSGAIEWLCFPTWEDPSIFSTLMGGPGSYEVRPTTRYVWGGHYEEGTLIWRDRWVTSDGSVVECREALALPATSARTVVLRRVEVLVGRCQLQVTVNPRPGYGKGAVRCWHRVGDDVFSASAEGLHLRLSGAEEASEERDGHEGRLLSTTLSMAEGEHHDLVLEIGAERLEDRPESAERYWQRTVEEWRRRMPDVEVPSARRDACHACAVLHGLTSASGAMMAAATTSLPERAGSGRNYDYRYAWVRDMALAGQAMATAAPQAAILDDWTGFLRDRVLEDGPKLAPAYTSAGARVPAPRRLSLPGYPGGHDVAGNQVRHQFQLDSLGEVLVLFAAMARLGRLDDEGWRAVVVAGEAIAQRWAEPDSGFWELEPQWFTESRLACAAGLRSVAAVEGGPDDKVAEWTSLADAIVAETSRRCTHPSGRFQRAQDDERVDAALLLPPLRGALPADDPRVAKTIAAVRQELAVDGYVYRYQADERPLGEAEGAFLMCGLVMSLAELSQGNIVAGARWFERTRGACGPPGLFSEEFDVGQRQLRGNLPQAFVHGLLLEAAARQQVEPVG